MTEQELFVQRYVDGVLDNPDSFPVLHAVIKAIAASQITGEPVYITVKVKE